MIFIFGGEYSGKSEYARKSLRINKIEDYDAPFDVLKTAEAVRDFHLRIRGFLRDGKNIKKEIDRLLELNPNIVIISNEIGCGIVPIDKFDREYREAVGRASCYLSERAKRVVRVVCGIGVIIK